MNHIFRAIGLGLLLAVATTGCATDGDQGQSGSSRVLVFGGTGRLGSEIAKTLVDNGHAVTVFARPESNRRRLEGLEVAFVVGDVLQADQVSDAIGKVQPTVVVDALGRGSSPVEFYADSARHIASASAQHGVTQIILHGSVGAGDSVTLLGSSLSERSQRLYGAKSAGEKAVMESGVNYTVIRNWRLLSHGVGASGTAVLTTNQQSTGSVSRADLAELTLGCVAASDCFNQIYHAIQASD